VSVTDSRGCGTLVAEETNTVDLKTEERIAHVWT